MRLTALLAPDAEYQQRDLPVGSMEPTHRICPPCDFTHGHDAIALAVLAGYDLYQFQQDGLIDKLGAQMVELRDGSMVERWAAQETADVISRRNGKSVEIEVLILSGLFLLAEKQIMYTAHRDDTAKAVFDNVRRAIERTPELLAEVAPNGFRVANGQRSITLRRGHEGSPGAVVYFRTRTNDSARGQGFDRLILDEAQDLTEQQMAAVLPVVTGSENAQINYAGSAGGLDATVQAKVWRSFEAKERGLCYRGWHADPEADFNDLDLVARMNPRLGRGLSYEFVAKEFARMTRSDFGRERMGASTYPREAGAAWVIPEDAWLRTVDEESAIAEDQTPRFVFESDPQLEYGTIGVAGRRPDGAMHLEVIAHDPGVAWMIEAAVQLQAEHSGEVWLDPKGPLGFIVGDLTQAGVAVRLFEAVDLTGAWAWLSTAANPQPDPTDPAAVVPAPTVRQRGGQLMSQALAAAETRKLLDRLTLRRSVSSETAQGPIFAPMLAGWAVVKAERRPPAPPSPRGLRNTDGRRQRPTRTRPSTSTDIATAKF